MNALNYLDFYPKKFGIFYNGKERISTNLGLTLTLLHVLFTLFLFIYYGYRIIFGKELNVRESNVFQLEAPSIDIINSNLFYFAFGVEDPITTDKFIDETIYYPKVIYYNTKKEDKGWSTIEKRYLNLERCDEKKFGKEYQHLIKKGSLNNSYCIENINLTLGGSFRYEKMAYLKIIIYPCINTTENKNHCKSQDIIDYYLSNNYFSLLSKDVGLTPFNYSNPTVPTLQDLYTSIGKSFQKEYELYYQISEIETDNGLFFDKVKKEKYLQFSSINDKMNIRNEEDYYNGKAICRIQIRLVDTIKVQKRSNMKIPDALALIGGYLRLISTVFTLISTIPNDINTEKELINELFHFDSFLDSECIPKIKNKLNNEINQNKSKMTKSNVRFSTNLPKICNDRSKSNIMSSMVKESQKKNFISNKSVKDNFQKLNKNYENSNNMNLKDNSLINQLRIFDDNLEFKRIESIIDHYKRSDSKSFEIKPNNINDINIIKKNGDQIGIDSKIKIKFNLFQYFFCRKCSNKNIVIDAFNEAASLYHKQMDVVNIFNCLTFIKENNLN